MVKGASTLIVRLTPYGESPMTSSFDVSGFDTAYLPLLNALASNIIKRKKP
jgi:hypothetical protein